MLRRNYNLLMANPHATFDQIVQCCKMAEIHPAIEVLPQGYQTEIGERGSGLSGGQKQRLSIARALLKQPKVLIFDEATSSLDSNTAEHFALTINQLKGNARPGSQRTTGVRSCHLPLHGRL